MPAKNIRQAAAQRSAIERESEPVPERPEPAADDPRVGLQRGRERALLYLENLVDLSASIAFGTGTKSLHTRLQASQLLWSVAQEAPDPLPSPPSPMQAQAREMPNGEAEHE